jgi:uncharacterized protein
MPSAPDPGWQVVRVFDPRTVPAPDPTPVARDGLLFSSAAGEHLFVTEGSRLYDIHPDMREEASAALQREGGIAELLDLGSAPAPSLPSTALGAISLAISQTCNLSCGYCYAEGGNFGGTDSLMSESVARGAVDRLLAGRSAGERASIAFLGGEPLANRKTLYRVTRYASDLARAAGIRLSFSLTTNGTLLSEDDIRFFNEHAFTVTVSVDGAGSSHDALRPTRTGKGSFSRVMARCAPLLSRPRKARVIARATVTRRNLQLKPTLLTLLSAGFDAVGFSPLMKSPNGEHELSQQDMRALLDELIGCSDEFESALERGRILGFSNLVNALVEIHRGSAKALPCGAGAGYAGVSATGGLYRCHRFVDDETAKMGDVFEGTDDSARQRWLVSRHVDSQQPCGSCWARYLCGGGCHHEVIDRDRVACDYIRGWLEHCLGIYLRLQNNHPLALRKIVGEA